MVTGIEIGPGYCVLVRARLRDNDVEVTAARVLEGPDWAEDGALQVAQLRDLRRELHLPKRAAVVAWNEVRKASEFSAETVITAAGFDLRQVLSPTDALGLLASADPRATDAATAWLSINDHGAAIAVVHGREIVHAREFPWRIQASEQRVQAHLLRRYLYVAQLTPEVRRAIDIVRQERGVEIDRAITCGTVPDLRSLTMPLIRELDIEFETLDSMEGLRSPAAVASSVAAVAPAIRLAGAAAACAGRGTTVSGGRWIAAAAGLVLATGAVWWALGGWADERTSAALRSDGPPQVSARVAQPSGTIGTSQPAAPSDVQPEETPLPARVPKRPTPTQTGLLGSSDDARNESAEAQLPNVGGVLISADRRLAVVNGEVVGIGDRVGSRTVTQIELDAIVLRDPSGRLVRVPTRTKPGGAAP